MANKTLLLDADVLTYSVGGLKNQDGNPESWPVVVTMIDTMIENMLIATGCTTVKIYLSSDDKSNFRLKTATIAPYKGHRKTEKPYHWQSIRNFLIESRDAVVVFGMEADDKLSMDLMSDPNAVLASIDKDLDNTPGWHYNWSKGKKYKVSETQAIQNFYKQLLTGDSTDNIPGLYGVGPKSTHVDWINSVEEEQRLYEHVKYQYKLRFGNYWRMFMWENAELLWILRSPNVNELKERFEELEALSTDLSLNQQLDSN